MSTVLLPQAFWFRLSVPCQRVDSIPRPGAKRLLDLPARCRIPQSSLLDGREPWADIRTAWNPGGLAVSIEAQGDLIGLTNNDRPEGSYGMMLLIDTRDTRDVSRATRFCHRFDIHLVKLVKKTELGVVVERRPIPRALADAPPSPFEAILTKTERTITSWCVELFFKAEALNGFEPETNRRLGFCYRVFDPDRSDEILGVGREFPLGENPSLWSTLELVDPD